MEKYLPLKENAHELTHLKVELYYSKGGMNYWNYKEEPRGYYFSVTPVAYAKTSYGLVTETFSTSTIGAKFLVKEVTRKSQKAGLEAEQIAELYKDNFIERILMKYGLELA